LEGKVPAWEGSRAVKLRADGAQTTRTGSTKRRKRGEGKSPDGPKREKKVFSWLLGRGKTAQTTITSENKRIRRKEFNLSEKKGLWEGGKNNPNAWGMANPSIHYDRGVKKKKSFNPGGHPSNLGERDRRKRETKKRRARL